MTDKEISRLKRSELLEILYSLRKEIDLLQDENEKLKQKLSEQQSETEKYNELLQLVRETNSIVKGESQKTEKQTEQGENSDDK